MNEIKASLVAFAVVFVSYGIMSSMTAAVVGASFGISPSSHALISVGVYALVGLVLGAAFGIVLGFYHGLTGIVLPDGRARFVFSSSAAVSFFYFFQCFFLLQPYLQLNWTRWHSKEIILPPLAIAFGLFLIFLHRLLSSPGGGRWRSPLAGLVLLAIVGLSLVKAFGVAPQRLKEVTNNVFLISVDTLNVDFIGSYGNPEIETPAIDSLARDGALFENVYATAPYTWSSLASVLTGQFTLGHGLRKNGWPLDPEAKTLPEIFQEAGYSTAAHADLELREMGLHQGFDRLLRDEQGVFDRQPLRRLLSFVPYFSSGFGDTSLPGTLTVRRWLRALTSGEKNLLWVHFYKDSPHLPTTPPEPYFSMYVPKRNTSSYDGGDTFIESLNRAEAIPTPDDLVKIKALYAGEVTWCDRQVGILLDELKRRGLYESSTIVFFSDHGQAFGSKRNYYRHGNFLFNSILRVPLIIKPPGNNNFAAGIRIKQRVSLKDVLPTVAELEGVELDSEGLDGESLVPFLEQDPNPSYEFWNYAETLMYDHRMAPMPRGTYRVGFSIMNDDWKLITVPEYAEQQLYRAEDIREDKKIENAEVTEALHAEALKRFGFETIEDIVRVEKVSVSEETKEMLRALGYH